MGARWDLDGRSMRARWDSDGTAMGQRWLNDGSTMGQRWVKGWCYMKAKLCLFWGNSGFESLLNLSKYPCACPKTSAPADKRGLNSIPSPLGAHRVLRKGATRPAEKSSLSGRGPMLISLAVFFQSVWIYSKFNATLFAILLYNKKRCSIKLKSILYENRVFTYYRKPSLP